jgi:L-ascorbate metabolism protein UlaG (beta-lactamase superfamily)
VQVPEQPFRSGSEAADVRIRWFGQSAFLLVDNSTSVLVDPFGAGEQVRERGLKFEYPPIDGIEADLVLVTHEHFDHNAVEVVSGDPHVLRSTAGLLDSPLGEVVAVASEHDDAAGTKRGPNTVFVFSLGAIRVCHMGDFGQAALRPEQHEAIGEVDLLMLPVGGGPTIGGALAAEIASQIGARIVVPMHFRTNAVVFHEPPDDFLDNAPGRVERVEGAELELDDLPSDDGVVVALLEAPLV